MSERRKTSNLLMTALLFGGLCTIFVAQRILGDGRGHDLTDYAGIALVLAAGLLRLMAWNAARDDVRAVEGRLLGAYGGVAASLLLYALQTEAGVKKLGLTGTAAEHVPGMLFVLFLSILLVSVFAILFMELAYQRMPVAASVERRRVRTALHAGLSLGLAIVFLISANYVATERDVRKDVSYFRTSQPSAATRSMVQKLDKPVKVILLFPQASDVLGQVRPYFAALAAASKKLSYEVRDVALSPELAQKNKLRSNGEVLLLQGTGDQQKSQAFHIGEELTEARATLKKLDGNFQEAFNQLARPERGLYVTVGHGEHNSKASDLPPADGTSVMEEILRRLNLKTTDFGLANGLGSSIPSDAGAIAIIGPSERFLPEEVHTLTSYVQKGGKLLLMLEPDKDVGLAPLLEALGLELSPGTALSDSSHMARAYNNSDRAIIYSNHYSSHPAVTTVSRHQREVATVFVAGGALKQKDVKTGPKPAVTFPLRTDQDFWRDLNHNFERDADEPLESLNLIAAATFKQEGKSGDAAEGRAIVIADGDFITNKVASNNGNMLVFVDALGWLVGNEDLSGETNSEEDVAIEHSREQDKVWFYATTFAMPAPIVFIGLFVARRRRKRAERKA